MKVKSENEVIQSSPTLSDTKDCSLPGSFVHGLFQARVLEWGAIAFSDDQPRQCIKKQRHYFFVSEWVHLKMKHGIHLTENNFIIRQHINFLFYWNL